jgi:hypothetical protein
MQSFDTYNPAWQGWVFEFRLLHTLTKIKNTSEVLNLPSLDEASYPALNVLVSNVLRYSGPDKGRKSFENNTLFIPEKWNQGCFDAVYFHENNGQRCFDFLNATIAESHVFKFQHMAFFLGWAIGSPTARDSAYSDVKVTLYAVTSVYNRNRFNPSACEVIGHESMGVFDSSFSPKPVKSRVLQILHTGEFFSGYNNGFR